MTWGRARQGRCTEHGARGAGARGGLETTWSACAGDGQHQCYLLLLLPCICKIFQMTFIVFMVRKISHGEKGRETRPPMVRGTCCPKEPTASGFQHQVVCWSLGNKPLKRSTSPLVSGLSHRPLEAADHTAELPKQALMGGGPGSSPRWAPGREGGLGLGSCKQLRHFPVNRNRIALFLALMAPESCSCGFCSILRTPDNEGTVIWSPFYR